jgi:hypothetical protein
MLSPSPPSPALILTAIDMGFGLTAATLADTLFSALFSVYRCYSIAVDMRIGLTAATLAKAGIRGLPASYVLPLSVKGHLDSPQIDWQVAVRKLAVLSAMQLGRDAVQQQQQLAPGQSAAAAATPDHAAAAGGATAGGSNSYNGGLAGLVPGLFGAANRALSNAASSFIGQVRLGCYKYMLVTVLHVVLAVCCELHSDELS